MTKLILFIIPVFLILGVGTILLQIFLSRRESKWLGLILPGLSLLVSLLYCMNIMATGDLMQDIILVFTTFFIANIPTMIFLLIYFICRKDHRKKGQMDKMKIQDLD